MTMRLMTAAALAGAAMLGACGPTPEEQRAAADAAAANFTPPSVTSRLDFGSSTERRFRSLDRNSDDVIDREEIPSLNARMRRLDRNNDGDITSSEFNEGMLARFDGMDLNRDGTVTSEERETYRSGRAVPASAPAPLIPLSKGD